MEFLTSQTRAMEGARNNQAVTFHGAVHALRDLGGVTFLTLRTREGLIQCVCTGREALDGATEECTVTVAGVLRDEPRAPGGVELSEAKITVLTRPAAPPPVPLAKKKLDLNLDTELSLRPAPGCCGTSPGPPAGWSCPRRKLRYSPGLPRPRRCPWPRRSWT